jgi:hypothetical protein
MADAAERPIDLDELERAVRETDPSARLVPPRILRRVIKRAFGLRRGGLQVPHRHVYATSTDALRGVVEGDEIGIPDDLDWPEDVILLERPVPEELAAATRAEVLADYWRLLFHGRVHLALERELRGDHSPAHSLAEKIERIGAVEFEEIGTVLRQEGMLLPPGDARTAYVEFAAYYLELRRFAPALLPHTFPGLEHREQVEELLAEDVDSALLFAATQIEGAPEPNQDPVLEPVPSEVESPLDGDDEDEAVDPATGSSRRLIHRATLAGARGNVVRAAILRTQAARRAVPELAESVRSGARSELDRLVRRLQRALGFDETEAERWRRALPPLLERSARGFWTAEARLLYDLQKVCVDHERDVFTIDLVAWALALGRRPIRRFQTYVREVMIATHLRSASGRLRAVRLDAESRARLAALVHAAEARAEQVLRWRLRGPIDATLATTGFVPTNLPERVAYRKLVEELLDRIVSRGFLSIGDLRDACSRSKLKMPDLAGPLEFLAGDRLLQADEALSRSLDGVYRHGEFYLRWLQRFSSLAFATTAGRFLTSYIALPYGGAFLVLEGLQHLVGPVVYWLRGWQVHIMNLPSFLTVGTVALGVIDFPGFRHRFVSTLRAIGRGVRMVVFDSLAWLLGLPLFRLVFAGRFASLVWRFGLKPGLVALPFWLVGRAAGMSARPAAIVSGIVYLQATIAMNTRLGRQFEEILADEAVRFWRQLYRELVPGLFRLVMATFDTVLETVDRLLYAVDEWLRFRSGQRRGELAAKAVLGAIWFFVAYLVRFYVNLLIEPQVNPIKHFPVVTVSHKIILPLSPTLKQILAAPLMPLGKVAADFIAWTTVLLLPGVFGFLVWELKENWRLYAANRRRTLSQVMVGSHGEPIGRLLRPGFHSGTLPKLFARLRRGERRWLRGGHEKSVIRHLEALHHVEEAIVRFVEREFLALVHESRTLGSLEVAMAELSVSTNRIRIRLGRKDEPAELLTIDLAERAGRLIADVADPGWAERLSEPRRRALAIAIVGFYKLGGIEWLREPWPAGPETMPPSGSPLESGPALLSFQRVEVTWQSWVEAWESDQAGKVSFPEFLEGLPVLPRPARDGGARNPSHA